MLIERPSEEIIYPTVMSEKPHIPSPPPSLHKPLPILYYRMWRGLFGFCQITPAASLDYQVNYDELLVLLFGRLQVYRGEFEFDLSPMLSGISELYYIMDLANPGLLHLVCKYNAQNGRTSHGYQFSTDRTHAKNVTPIGRKMRMVRTQYVFSKSKCDPFAEKKSAHLVPRRSDFL